MRHKTISSSFILLITESSRFDVKSQEIRISAISGLTFLTACHSFSKSSFFVRHGLSNSWMHLSGKKSRANENQFPNLMDSICLTSPTSNSSLNRLESIIDFISLLQTALHSSTIKMSQSGTRFKYFATVINSQFLSLIFLLRLSTAGFVFAIASLLSFCRKAQTILTMVVFPVPAEP